MLSPTRVIPVLPIALVSLGATRRMTIRAKEQPRRVWECWATRQDIDGLLRWQDRFGPDFRALLVFIYLLGTDADLSAIPGDLWTWRGQRYLLRAVPVEDYQLAMRTRSPKWDTVSLPGKTFRELARPFHCFTDDFHPQVLDDCPF